MPRFLSVRYTKIEIFTVEASKGMVPFPCYRLKPYHPLL